MTQKRLLPGDMFSYESTLLLFRGSDHNSCGNEIYDMIRCQTMIVIASYKDDKRRVGNKSSFVYFVLAPDNKVGWVFPDLQLVNRHAS